MLANHMTGSMRRIPPTRMEIEYAIQADLPVCAVASITVVITLDTAPPEDIATRALRLSCCFF